MKNLKTSFIFSPRDTAIDLHKTQTSFRYLFVIAIFIFSIFNLQSQMFWNQAGNFNGSSYIAAPNTLSLNIVGSVTVEAWVYPMTNTGIRYVVFKGNVSNGYYLRINSNGTVGFGTNGINRINSTQTVPQNKWTHIAGSYNVNNDEFKIFVNGLIDGTLISNNPPANNTDSLFIGKYSSSFFTGYIDEVRIWTKAAEPNDIRRNLRTSLSISSGKYTSLLFSMPFQRVNSQGNVFTIQDLSFNPISVNPTVNRGVTAIDLSNRPSTYLSGNESLQFEGNFSSYAALPNNSLNSLTGAMTIEAWINVEGSSAVNQYIVHKNAPGGNGYRLMLNSSQKLSFSLNNAAFNEGSSIIEYNKWYHIAWVVSPAGATSLYINGNLDAYYGSAGTPLANSDSLFFGRGFNGMIDEIRFFRFERTAADIKKTMFESIDESNAPSGDCFVFNFDGSAWANKNLQFYFLRGNTYFSSPATLNAASSPLIRADNINFREGFYKKISNRRIPETGNTGLMVDDSIMIPDNVNINDVNLYLSLIHGAVEQLQITLISPTGQNIQLVNGYIPLGAGVDFTTIIDDQADSTLSSNTYIHILSRMKSLVNLNSVFSGSNAAGVWKLKIQDISGLETGKLMAWGLQFNNTPVIGIQTISNEIPGKFELGQNYPNPFNPKTNFKIQLSNSGNVKITVYDITGKEVKVLVNEFLTAGVYDMDFDASQLSSGAYFYKLEVRESGSDAVRFTDVKKMMLIK